MLENEKQFAREAQTEKERKMGQETAYTPEMTWEKLTEFPGEGEVQRLRDQEPDKGKTLLIRLHAGGHINPHSHLGAVQHYILEGEYETDGKIYGAGTYRLFPPHADVPDISTQNGVTILMIYDPVC